MRDPHAVHLCQYSDLNCTVSKAFELSVHTIMVTSPHFIARIRLSRIHKRTVVVE